MANLSEIDDPLFAPPEAAAKTRMSLATLARWRSIGFGPAYLVLGGRIFYRYSALEAFLAASTRKAGGASICKKPVDISTYRKRGRPRKYG